MKTINEFSWMIGGPQGSGVDSSANLFLRACAVAGLRAYGKREYHSNIIGEHSYFQVRVSEKYVYSHVDPVHLLMSFDKETAHVHSDEVVSGGYFFYDPQVTKLEELHFQDGVVKYEVPYKEILEEISAETGQPYGKVQIMKNVICVAISWALLGMDKSYLERALKGIFTGSKAKLVAMNMSVVDKAYKFVTPEMIEAFPHKLQPVDGAEPSLILSGTTACALGKLKAGCKFQSYYPITPASDESVYLESHPEYGVNVVQCEDEIAAMCMAVGASLTGTRSATSSSGPGFGLKAEGLGWAGINEVPVVVYNYQRGGPSTGLPTRHEQGDLLFSLFICHGEFPKIVVAPGDIAECFEYSFHAFNYADMFQTPVIMIPDKAQANNTMTIPVFDESKLVINRGKMATDEHLEELSKQEGFKGQFPRFDVDYDNPSKDPISMRAVPGQKHGIFWCTGDEHDKFGHISEDPATRIAMQTKRMSKLKLALETIPKEQQYTLYGPEDADITVVTWGSAKGPLLDAMPILASDGIKMNVLQIRLMSPFPAEDVTNILKKAKVKVGFEMNYTGQLAKLVALETGIQMDHQVSKFTGRPISETEAVSAIREIANQKTERVVLSYGR